MALERFVIEELGGINRNLVDGLGKQPDELRNALGDRMGGYRYYGQAEDIIDVNDYFANTASVVSHLLSSGNRYGYYRNAAGHYGLHTLGLPPADSVKVNTTWAPSVAASSSNGAILTSGYFSAPGVRYGPWYVPSKPTAGRKFGEPALAFNETVAGPYLSYTASGVDGNLPAGDYTVRAAFFQETQKGRLVFHVEQPGLFTNVTLAVVGKIQVTVPVGKAGWDGAHIYVDAHPTGSDSVLRQYVGVVSGIAEGLVLEITDISDLSPSSDIFINPDHELSVFHDGRFYHANPTVFTPYSTGPLFGIWNGPGWDQSSKRDNIVRDIQYENFGSQIFVHFTEVVPLAGAVNMTKALNFFRVSPSSGGGINALASTPAGLMVFCENEIFLMRGDPASQPQLLKFSSTIGNTPGIRPVSLAGVVFNIYGGEIYAYSLGMGDVDFGSGVGKVSGPVYLPNDPFVELVADPQNNLILARTESDGVFIYDAGNQQWLEHPFSGAADLRGILNYGGAPDAEGGLFLFGVGSLVAVNKTGGQGVLDREFVLGYSELDFGDKRAKKLFRGVEVYTNPEYAGLPMLYYRVGEMPAEVGLAAESFSEGRHVFRLPVGCSGATGSFHFEFSQMGANDVVEPPIVFNYVPKGRRRI